MSNAKPLSEYKTNTNNGVWFMLHHMAEKAVTRSQMESYGHFFRELCKRMEGCDCGGHCTEMLERLKPEDYFHLKDENGIPDGCMRHACDCHNEVNKRLGKPQYPYDVIKSMWRPTDIPKPCTRNNSPAEHSKSSEEPKNTQVNKKMVNNRHNNKQPSRFQMIILDEQ